tara:strand:- start:197 stop:1267 length:1071 start_codon:yes stop_codon:yes gene_type:complete
MWARTTPRMMGQTFRSLRAGWVVGRKSLDLVRRLRDEAQPEQRRVPRTLFNAQVSPHRAYGALTWNIPELKRMRQLCPGATLNDVVIAIIGGGMRRYLMHHNQLPANESLVSMCPVSVRPTEAMKDCGNLISAMFIGIGTDMADATDRLAAVRRRTARGVPLAKDVLCDLNNAVGDMIPPYMRALGAWVQNKARLAGVMPLINTLINTLITNVPGIPGLQPRYFAGAKIVNVFPIAPVCDGMGVSHCLTGIYDDLNLGVLADRKMMPDMDQYIACMAASTDEYRALLAELEKAAAAEPVLLETRKPGADAPAAGTSAAESPAAQPETARQAGRRRKASSRSGDGSAAASAKPAGAA